MQAESIELRRESETDMLSRIVDAMLKAQTELHEASEEENWSRILVDACRREKAAAPRENLGACAAC